jgi:hypothetical protein
MFLQMVTLYRKKGLAILVVIPAVVYSFLSLPEKNGIATVSLKLEDGHYQLYRHGEPYFIKGAGGYLYYDKLKACGGNSVRLWTTENAKEYLDNAEALGLTVNLGLDLGLERKGFNYSDKNAVKAQFELVKKEVLKFKDHPALLMWSIGNELDQFAHNFAVWDAVNDIAKYIHQVDPNHPVTTMLAGVPVKHIRQIVKRCPELDLLSINAFRWIEPVKKDITAAGWKGPYLIGEWGASGYWESEKLPWGTFLEETSSQKAQACKERYKVGILDNTDRCVGAYVFYWGWKQARTHTLLSLFSENGDETPMIDVLHYVWTGKERSNRAPEIFPIGIDEMQVHKGIYLKPSSQHNAFTDAADPDNDTLAYYWEIYHESKEKKEGGDTEAKPAAVSGLMTDAKSKILSFKAPQEEGAYRLFVTVYDGHGHIAFANAPFYVKK